LPHIPLKVKISAGLLLAIIVISIFAYVMSHHTVAMLEPRGEISYKQRQLMQYAAILAAVVIVPVYIMTAVIAIKYRESRQDKEKYTPDWDTHRGLEAIWWGIPCLIIFILAVITWQSSHSLDPYKPLASAKQPLTVQVIALDWKWLFIYPEQRIASVNELALPVNTPVHFDITADAPMNSFWIPQLGGQIYAMPGMTTQLNLMADKAGNYRGSSANISGEGFSGMVFTAKVRSDADFTAWVHHVRQQPASLSLTSYEKLATPSQNDPVSYYRTVDPTVYDTVVMKYMGH
jgi:cytochrome o ubiquinol oxidase subunit 2